MSGQELIRVMKKGKYMLLRKKNGGTVGVNCGIVNCKKIQLDLNRVLKKETDWSSFKYISLHEYISCKNGFL